MIISFNRSQYIPTNHCSNDYYVSINIYIFFTSLSFEDTCVTLIEPFYYYYDFLSKQSSHWLM